MGEININNQKEFFKLISYMVTSARGCIDEPKIYGSFRLLDSICKLYNILEKKKLIEDDKLKEVINKIEDNKYNSFKNKDKFINSLDMIILDLVDLMD